MRRREFIASIGLFAITGCSRSDLDRDRTPASIIEERTTSRPTGTASGSDPRKLEIDRALTPKPTPSSTPTTTETKTPTPVRTERRPRFELIRWNVPAKTEIGEKFSVGITIKNTGGETGSYRGQLYVKRSDTWWRPTGRWTFQDVEPSETVSASSYEQWYWPYMTDLELRLGDFKKTALVSIGSAHLNVGEPFVNPKSISITVTDIEVRRNYEYVDALGEEQDVAAPAGKTFVFVHLRVRNEGEEVARPPLTLDFLLQHREHEYRWTNVRREENEYESAELDPSDVHEGWLAFETPDSIEESELDVVYDEIFISGRVRASWN